MIEVWVRRDGARIAGYRVEGHAGWAESGSDIVCAAVSALAIAAANGLDRLAGAVSKSESSEGRLEVALKGGIGWEAEVKAEAILETMLGALRDIRDEYPGRIKIYD